MKITNEEFLLKITEAFMSVKGHQETLKLDRGRTMFKLEERNVCLVFRNEENWSLMFNQKKDAGEEDGIYRLFEISNSDTGLRVSFFGSQRSLNLAFQIVYKIGVASDNFYQNLNHTVSAHEKIEWKKEMAKWMI